MSTSRMELVNRLFSEPDLRNIEMDLRDYNSTNDTWSLFQSLTKKPEDNTASSSDCSEGGRLFNRRGKLSEGWRPYSAVVRNSTLSRDAPEFVPSTYAAAAAFGVSISLPPPMIRPPPPRHTAPTTSKPKVIPEITANNQPRPPVRMTPTSLRRFASPEISLPVFQASYQVSAVSSNKAGFHKNPASFPTYCIVCKNFGESEDQYRSHCLRNPLTNKVVCPKMRSYACEVCGTSGDDAHFENKCPLNLISKDNPSVLLSFNHFKRPEGKER